MDPVTLRAIERILVVLFAGMAIYLGYRLFLAVPAQRDSDGKVTLPGGAEVVLNRAAPGLFFALFGSVALGISLHSAVQATSTPAMMAGDAATLTSYSGLAPEAGGIDPTLEQAQLRRLFFTLNALGDASSTEGSQAVAERGDLRQAKLRLMRPAWLGAWGDYAAFSDWANATDARGEPPDARFSEPAALYHQGRERP
ncbi:hypothetical protein [Halomonas rhizosphaerae]|uniref:Uncharacterized protein n=1 Tax=Halomonas rhizosphaerae TaxID=3043296 RepID=A0ABT6V2L6_9GAMM|nr:hypothetical protein [Halomonas rhizosphaerae]MDI5892446.1 hypothetical protein [Halomonas rhizosphaerae]